MPDPELTHDTINYTISAMYNARKLSPYEMTAGEIIKHDNIFSVSDEVLKEIYLDDELFAGFCFERDNLKQFKGYKDISFIVPLHIYSNICLDRYLASIAKKYGIIDAIVEGEGSAKFMAKVNKSLNIIAQENVEIFTPHALENLKNNLEALHFSWRLLSDGNKKGVDEWVGHYIGMLNLADPFA